MSPMLIVALVVAPLAALSAWAVLRKREPAPRAAAAQPPTTAEALDQLRSFARLQVHAAFDTRDEIVEATSDIAANEYGGLALSARIPALVDELLAEHSRAEACWPEVTDCDRLDTAFALMEARGIVARQNFACCQGCGHAEIGDEIAQASAQHPVVGYVFYHRQDTEGAAEGLGLCLAYGSVSGQVEATVGVGQRIVACLREAGLRPDWTGEVTRRICVPLDWKRRRRDRPT